MLLDRDVPDRDEHRPDGKRLYGCHRLVLRRHRQVLLLELRRLVLRGARQLILRARLVGLELLGVVVWRGRLSHEDTLVSNRPARAA